MTPKDNQYTEQSLVENASIEIFKTLEWEYKNCIHEFDKNGKSFLGRDNKSEVIIVSKLKPVLIKLNSKLPEQAIDEAVNILIQDRSVMGMVNANKEVYDLLKNGVKVSFVNDKNEHITENVKIIDWNEFDNNNFFLASQFWIAGEMYLRRADLIGFINGIPLLFIELKACHKDLKKAYDDNLRDYKSTVSQLFWFNNIIILSNGSKSKLGTISSSWEYFADWKKINEEGEKGVISLDTVLKGVCDREKILDIIENYILFKEEKSGDIKIICKNHQYLGVEKSIKEFSKKDENNGRIGVFWHTQGSGKSISMIFFAQKILRKIDGDWTFVIVTDRQELDEQIYKNFVRTGAINGKQERAENGHDLKKMLKENHRYVFTTIQKFRTEKGQIYPELSDRSDIIVITDEAHRTQYDIFAMNMRNALPNASFIGFTGTPLMMTGEEKTKDIFGDYVSIYNFKQAVDDNSTVRLYYENRKPKLQLVNLFLNEDIEKIIDDAEFNEEQEKKFEREFSKEHELIIRKNRLEEVAKDIVAHFMNRGFMGKAMVVSIDKATAIKMYDKVKKYWNEYAEELNKEYLKTSDYDRKDELEEKLIYMKRTDMAVVVSSAQNEVEDMKDKGVDIVSHRKRLNKESLDEKFKDADDPFRIVFVCGMWMTGFDVPSCSTIYLDKPMKNHSLMQTIARVNRVYDKNKISGLIVDYIGMFHYLNKALAIYASGSGNHIDSPIIEKSFLIDTLRNLVNEMQDFLKEKKISLSDIIDAEGFDCIKLLDDAIENLLENDDVQKEFKEKNIVIQKIYKAILPDKDASEFQKIVKVLKTLNEKLNSISYTVDISDVLNSVSDLLNKSIKVESKYPNIKEGIAKGYYSNRILDLSVLNFDKLKEEFDKGKKKTLAEELKKIIEVRLKALCLLNKSRIDYMEKFKELIDDYNAGSMNVEEYYNSLLDFVKKLNIEEKRAITENLTEEELAVFDILINPPIKISKKDVLVIKKIAKELLEKLKDGKLVLDWKKKQQAKASVQICIAERLENLPQVYTDDIYDVKCGMVYQHVYDSYYGAGKSLYGVMK